MISLTGLKDSLGISELSFKNKRQNGREVKKGSPMHHTMQLVIRQIFVKHQEIVAKIEEGLVWVLAFQGSSPHVIDSTLWYAPHLSTPGIKSPAKVDFLHVGKEASIQTSCLTIVLQADKKTCTCSPKHFHRGIILPMVFLYGVKDTPPTKRIAIAIHETASSSCILKVLGLSPTFYLWLTSRHFRVSIGLSPPHQSSTTPHSQPSLPVRHGYSLQQSHSSYRVE